MNDKGQLDKIITTFPVMLLLFLLMAIYLFLAGGIFTLKGPSTPAYLESVNLAGYSGGDIMFKELDIMRDKNVLFFDAYELYKKGEIDSPFYFSGIEKMIISDNLDDQCLVFFSGANHGPFQEKLIFYAAYNKKEIYVEPDFLPDFLYEENKIKVNYPNDIKRSPLVLTATYGVFLYSESKNTKKFNINGEELYIYYGPCLRGEK